MPSVKSNKDFRVGDLIEFTGQLKKKEFTNLYMVRQILVEFNFSPESKKIEKEDETLPDVIIEIKVYPVVQEKTLKLFPEANKIIKVITDQVCPDYQLDKQGNICLFELGYRYGKNIEETDTRLEFEKIFL
jgi:hypothetical protein